MNNDDVMPDVRTFLELWARTFNAHDVEKLVALYADGALLHGTSSSKLYLGVEEIRTYFHGIAAVKFDVWHCVRLAANVVLVVGKYVFSRSHNDQRSATLARFTFVLRRNDGAWQILHHHSSRDPD